MFRTFFICLVFPLKLSSTFFWLNLIPLGLPVVPEDHQMAASSPGPGVLYPPGPVSEAKPVQNWSRVGTWDEGPYEDLNVSLQMRFKLYRCQVSRYPVHYLALNFTTVLS